MAMRYLFALVAVSLFSVAAHASSRKQVAFDGGHHGFQTVQQTFAVSGKQVKSITVHLRRERAAHSRHHGHKKNVARATTDRGCLTPDTRAVLDAAERHFSTKFALVSTCRPGAVIAGTHHASQHRYGRAVDMNVPRNVSKQAVVKWLYANAPGVTMVYHGMSHVHFDTGPFHKLACGGCGVRHHRMKLAHLR